MSKLKHCVDCKHHHADPVGNDLCINPKKLTYTNPVTGDKTGFDSCLNHRSDGVLFSLIISTCGRRARWFEPKNEWLPSLNPSFFNDCEYRKKPQKKVYEWQWILVLDATVYFVPSDFYASKKEVQSDHSADIVRKIKESKRERKS